MQSVETAYSELSNASVSSVCEKLSREVSCKLEREENEESDVVGIYLGAKGKKKGS